MQAFTSLFHNAAGINRGRYPFSEILSVERAQKARASMTRFSNYIPTPLVELADLGARTGVARLWYKDEATRFGLGSFKALGGAYAVGLLLAEKASRRIGRAVDIAELGLHRNIAQGVTICCATDGNHGLSVAAGAKKFGAKCVVFLHEGVSPGRDAAIANLGAETVRVAGSYDDSVRAALQRAEDEDWDVVSDTSWPGYETIPADVMQGYTVLVLEILEALAAQLEAPPTHVFLQGGVGGFAAAVVAHLWEVLDSAAPTFIVVEPERADCLFQSARAGRPVSASGNLDTVMAGLACGEVSPLAWRILRPSVEFFMTISDASAVETMKLLARGSDKTPPIVAGESAVAGLAGFLSLIGHSSTPLHESVNADSRVLVVGTEGATDPALYRTLVGEDLACNAMAESCS